MAKVNYLNNKDLTIEIHKSKTTYCIYETLKDIHYHQIISHSDLSVETIEKIFEFYKSYNPNEKKLSCMKSSEEFPRIKDISDLVIRVMTNEHVPLEPNPKTSGQKIKCLFLPFKHIRYVDGAIIEVGKSHWKGSLTTGNFSQEHGKITNKLALMYIKLVERYGSKSNWRGYCVDESTEALTQRGWIGIDQINENDKILSYHQGDMKWSNIKSIYRGDFDGLMHNLTMRGVDMLITPNHKLVTQRDLIPVEFLKQTDHLILLGNPVNDVIEKTYSDSFVELMGWILTEGCYDFCKNKDIKSITIYQNPGLKADRIRNCLIDLNYKFTETLRKQNIAFRIWKESSEEITKHFPIKNLNMEFILSLTLNQREILIDTMIDGDGWRRLGKHKSYVQKNKEHIDLFQILCTISGHRSMTKKRIHKSFGKETSSYTMNLYSQSKNTTKVCCIDFHGGMNNGRTHPGVGKENHQNNPTTYYKGKVWCPETEYGCFVARRNNTIYLTGNTYNDEMQSQALLQLSTVGLQFDESRSDNPFAYYTRIVNNSFTRILNLEKKVQKLRDDLLIMHGAPPSFTRQIENEQSHKDSDIH